MKGLMIHCGAQGVDRAELAQLPVPKAKGPRHVVRPFIEDVEMVTDYMKTEGIRIKDEAFGVMYKKGTDVPVRFFGVMQVHIKGFGRDKDYGLLVGLRGSYNQSLPRAIAVGSRVFVCDNLAFSGEVEIKTKQTLNVARCMPRLLQEAIAQVPYMAEHQSRRFEAYHNVTIEQQAGDATLVELVRLGVLNPSQMGKAVNEWDAPSYEQHAAEGLSVWRLQNAVTEAIKPANEERAAIPTAWRRTQTLTGVLDGLAGVA